MPEYCVIHQSIKCIYYSVTFCVSPCPNFEIYQNDGEVKNKEKTND